MLGGLQYKVVSAESAAGVATDTTSWNPLAVLATILAAQACPSGLLGAHFEDQVLLIFVLVCPSPWRVCLWGSRIISQAVVLHSSFCDMAPTQMTPIPSATSASFAPPNSAESAIEDPLIQLRAQFSFRHSNTAQ